MGNIDRIISLISYNYNNYHIQNNHNKQSECFEFNRCTTDSPHTVFTILHMHARVRAE